VTFRGLHLLPVAMFTGTFAWAFVYVSLPFHIKAISTLDAAATLRWTGWILGISSLVTVVTAPIWGRYAERGNPRTMYLVVETLQGLAFFGMALARTLPELFVARLVLGIMGAASTFAFIIASRAASLAAVRRQVAAVQSAMTVGQVIGPLAGAIAAAQLGFRRSFMLSGLILFGCAALVGWGVPDVAARPRPRGREGMASLGQMAAVALIILGGNIQVFFFPAILPQVLPDLGVEPVRMLEVGGVLIFVSGVAAALGALAAPRLGDLGLERPLLTILLVGSSALVAALAAVGSVWPYGTLRFLQVLAIAPVFPLVVARVAQYAGGQAIGVINSARIGAGFVGPVVATTVLAWTSPGVVYLLLGVLGLACVPLLWVRVALPRLAP
jgi:MFS transporter, DHA1 family, multidrug resistance protein